MNPVVVLAALIAGLLFGIWPLVMQKSGLDGFTSAFMFEFFALLTVLPFVFQNGIIVSGTKWWFGIVAGVIAGLGLVIFTTALTKAAPFEIAKVFLIMLASQVAVPALYEICFNNGLTIKVGCGIFTAILTVILLT